MQQFKVSPKRVPKLGRRVHQEKRIIPRMVLFSCSFPWRRIDEYKQRCQWHVCSQTDGFSARYVSTRNGSPRDHQELMLCVTISSIKNQEQPMPEALTTIPTIEENAAHSFEDEILTDDLTLAALCTVVVMQVCPDGQTPCAAPNYCAMPGNPCYNGIYRR